MHLYEIANEYRNVFDELSEIPELNQEIINDTLSPIKTEFDKKAINITSYFKNLEAEANAIREAEVMMYHRRKSIENKIENMKNYLKDNMKSSGINKISCPYFSVTLSKTKSKVNVKNLKEIPPSFIREKVIREADKEAILKHGGCEGAEIIENYALRIS